MIKPSLAAILSSILEPIGGMAACKVWCDPHLEVLKVYLHLGEVGSLPKSLLRVVGQVVGHVLRQSDWVSVVCCQAVCVPAPWMKLFKGWIPNLTLHTPYQGTYLYLPSSVKCEGFFGVRKMACLHVCVGKTLRCLVINDWCGHAI